MSLYQIEIIYSIYAFLGLVGVIIDLNNPVELRAFKMIKWYKLIVLLLAYIFLLGPICFYPALMEYLETLKTEKK